MTSRLAPMLFALLTLAACSSQDAPAPATAPAAPTAATAPAATEAATAAAPAAAEAPNNNPILPPQGPAPVAGTDYKDVAGGQPFQPGSGQIEVIEVFGYTCPHCAQFEPVVKAWTAKQPADVKFTALAAPFGGYWVPYAKAFYTAEAMGLLDKTHDAVFRAIHIERSLPVQPLPTDDQIGAFYAKYGANAQEFASTMSSFAIDAKMKRAQQFMVRSGVETTPAMIINGKYLVTADKGHAEMLRVTEHLIARERAPAQPAAAAPANGG